MLKQILKDGEARMHKAVDVVRTELTKIRTGKATTALLDSVKVDYYGTLTPLNQVGSVSVPDVHLITITPWDKGMLAHIEKAILAANLGLNPGSDGTVVRCPDSPA